MHLQPFPPAAAHWRWASSDCTIRESTACRICSSHAGDSTVASSRHLNCVTSRNTTCRPPGAGTPCSKAKRARWLSHLPHWNLVRALTECGAASSAPLAEPSVQDK